MEYDIARDCIDRAVDGHAVNRVHVDFGVRLEVSVNRGVPVGHQEDVGAGGLDVAVNEHVVNRDGPDADALDIVVEAHVCAGVEDDLAIGGKDAVADQALILGEGVDVVGRHVAVHLDVGTGVHDGIALLGSDGADLSVMPGVDSGVDSGGNGALDGGIPAGLDIDIHGGGQGRASGDFDVMARSQVGVAIGGGDIAVDDKGAVGGLEGDMGALDGVDSGVVLRGDVGAECGVNGAVDGGIPARDNIDTARGCLDAAGDRDVAASDQCGHPAVGGDVVSDSQVAFGGGEGDLVCGDGAGDGGVVLRGNGHVAVFGGEVAVERRVDAGVDGDAVIGGGEGLGDDVAALGIQTDVARSHILLQDDVARIGLDVGILGNDSAGGRAKAGLDGDGPVFGLEGAEHVGAQRRVNKDVVRGGLDSGVLAGGDIARGGMDGDIRALDGAVAFDVDVADAGLKRDLLRGGDAVRCVDVHVASGGVHLDGARLAGHTVPHGEIAARIDGDIIGGGDAAIGLHVIRRRNGGGAALGSDVAIQDGVLAGFELDVRGGIQMHVLGHLNIVASIQDQISAGGRDIGVYGRVTLLGPDDDVGGVDVAVGGGVVLRDDPDRVAGREVAGRGVTDCNDLGRILSLESTLDEGIPAGYNRDIAGFGLQGRVSGDLGILASPHEQVSGRGGGIPFQRNIALDDLDYDNAAIDGAVNGGVVLRDNCDGPIGSGDGASRGVTLRNDFGIAASGDVTDRGILPRRDGRMSRLGVDVAGLGIALGGCDHDALAIDGAVDSGVVLRSDHDRVFVSGDGASRGVTARSDFSSLTGLGLAGDGGVTARSDLHIAELGLQTRGEDILACREDQLPAGGLDVASGLQVALGGCDYDVLAIDVALDSGVVLRSDHDRVFVSGDGASRGVTARSDFSSLTGLGLAGDGGVTARSDLHIAELGLQTRGEDILACREDQRPAGGLDVASGLQVALGGGDTDGKSGGRPLEGGVVLRSDQHHAFCLEVAKRGVDACVDTDVVLGGGESLGGDIAAVGSQVDSLRRQILGQGDVAVGCKDIDILGGDGAEGRAVLRIDGHFAIFGDELREGRVTASSGGDVAVVRGDVGSGGDVTAGGDGCVLLRGDRSGKLRILTGGQGDTLDCGSDGSLDNQFALDGGDCNSIRADIAVDEGVVLRLDTDRSIGGLKGAGLDIPARSDPERGIRAISPIRGDIVRNHVASHGLDGDILTCGALDFDVALKRANHNASVCIDGAIRGDIALAGDVGIAPDIDSLGPDGAVLTVDEHD